MSDSQTNGSQSSSIWPSTFIVNACECSRSNGETAMPADRGLSRRPSSPASASDWLEELLAIEVELRISHGESPTPAEFRTRYPDWGHAITVAFENCRSAASRRGRTRACRRFRMQVDQPLQVTRKISDAEPVPADVTVGSVYSPDSSAGPISTGPLPERFGRYEVIEGAREGRVRHGLSGARRRAFAAGGDQGPAARAFAIARRRSTRS